MKINSSFSLLPWGSKLSEWEEKTRTLQEQILNVYNHIPSFKRYYLLFSNNIPYDQLINIITKDEDSLLPFSFLIKNSSDFFKKYNTDAVVDIIIKNRESHDKAFDLYVGAILSNISSHRVLSPSEKLLLKEWRVINADASEETKLVLNSDDIIETSTNYCIDNDINPLEFLSKLSIKVSPQSEYLTQLSRLIYINKLKKVDFSMSSNLIAEIEQRGLFDWRGNGNRLLGHEIISIIIDLFEHSNVHTDWIQLILSQAGDPRVSKSSKSYTKWWFYIDDLIISKFVKALSHEDILLFLDSIVDFAKQSNPDMQRMFRSRKQMLTGLSMQNLFSESRLFLPGSIYDFIKKEKPYISLEYVGILQGTNDKALIYLRAGNTHIIEGSHNCRLRIYDGLPENVDLMNPKKNWDYSMLTLDLERIYKEDLLKQPFAKSHDIKGNWKRAAISYLKKRFSFSHEICLTEQEKNFFRYE